MNEPKQPNRRQNAGDKETQEMIKALLALLKVVVVGSQTMQEEVCAALQPFGIVPVGDVDTSTLGQACSAIMRLIPHVIIIEKQLTDGSSIEVVREVKKWTSVARDWAAPPVFIVYSADDSPTWFEFAECSVNRIVEKTRNPKKNARALIEAILSINLKELVEEGWHFNLSKTTER